MRCAKASMNPSAAKYASSLVLFFVLVGRAILAPRPPGTKKGRQNVSRSWCILLDAFGLMWCRFHPPLLILWSREVAAYHLS